MAQDPKINVKEYLNNIYALLSQSSFKVLKGELSITAYNKDLEAINESIKRLKDLEKLIGDNNV